MKLEILNPVDCPHWDDLVLATNDYSFFHSSHWAKVLCKSYRYSPAYFTLTEKGKLLALMPIMEIRSILTGKRGVSLAFSDYCEPIVKDKGLFDVLLGNVIEYGKESGWKHIEFRGGQKFLSDAPVAARFFGHTLVLTGDEQQLLSCFRSNTKWSIRKATQEGVEIQFDNTLQSIKDFYRLHCMTRKRHDVPPQPFHFFKHIHDCILAENLGYVVLASYKGTLISGAVFFHFGDKALYKFSASDFKYRNLGANNLILWEAIKWYSQSGFKEFCFGRTDQDNEGLRKFKTGWGTTENDIYYYRYDIEEGKFADNDSSKMTKYSWYLEKLPGSMLRVIGHVLYRHMG
jgi:hypothetical protein